MKQFMFWVAALVMVFFTSCQQEQTPVTENAIVNFSISTPAIGTRADEFDTTGKDVASYGDGATVNVLKYALYEAELNDDGTVKALIGDAKPGTKANAFPEKATETTIEGVSAIKGKTYAAFFWAEAEGDPYTVEWTADGPIATLSDAAALANNENLDAFFGVHTFTLAESGQLEDNIYLKRPFAQLNIATTDKSDAAAAKVNVTETEIELTAPNSLNLLTGRTIGSTTVTLKMSAIPEDMYVDLEEDGKYDLLSFNYIFVDGDPYTANDQTKVTDQEVTFRYKYSEDAEDVKEYTFDGITLQRNHRTYVVGSLLTEVVTFYVKINPDWEDSHIVHGDGTGSTPPAAVDVSEPVIIDNATMNGYERVQLSWEVGDDVAKTIVSWGENDSETTEFAITQSNASMDKFLTTRAEGKRMTETIEVDEGEYTFKLVNEDANGNKSDAVTVDLKAYGQNWYSTLVTRPVKSVDFANGNATVKFEDTWANKADCSITTLTYTNKDGETATKQITNATTEVVCDNIAVGATISITSSYKPDNYIPEDTKVSPAIEKVVEARITVKVLQWNVANGVASSSEMQAWSTRKASVASFINTEAPDIIFGEELIEASNFMKDMMSTIDPSFTTGTKSDYMIPGAGAKYKGYYGDRNDGGEGVAVIYNSTRFEEVSSGRFWLWGTETAANGDGGDPSRPGKLILNGDSANCNRIAVWIRLRDKSTNKEFVVSSVHIDNSNTSADEAAGFPIMTWQVNTYFNNLQARSKGEDDLLPIIAGGDFNCGPQHSVITNISTLARYNYADTRIAARNLGKPISYPDTSLDETDAKSRSTFVKISRSWSFSAGYTYTCEQDVNAAFDYIFMKRCETLNFHKIHPVQVGDVIMSDHNPVTTEIVIKF